MANNDETTPAAGKGRATPKRKEREAANVRPLVLDQKADAKKRHAEAKKRRDREYEAMRTGDERGMPSNHAGRERRYVRDIIDARTTIGEFMLPISMIAFAVMMFAGNYPRVTDVAALAFTVILVALVIESTVLIRSIKRRVIEKFGANKVPPGLTFYALTRILQVRRLRMPKPVVERGAHPS